MVDVVTVPQSERDPAKIVHALRQIAERMASMRSPTLVSVTNIFVATSGSDNSDGVTSARAVATIQKAFDIARTYDAKSQNIWIKLLNGTYSGNATISGTIVGDNNTGGAYPINLTSATGSASTVTVVGQIAAATGAMLTVYDMTLTQTGNTSCLLAYEGGKIHVFQGIEFGASSTGHISAFDNGFVYVANNYKITGGCPSHYNAIGAGSQIKVDPVTVTITGSPNFSFQFAIADQMGHIRLNGGAITYSGTATGRRYLVKNNSTISTNPESSGTATNHSYLPGDANGVSQMGGVYA